MRKLLICVCALTLLMSCAKNPSVVEIEETEDVELNIIVSGVVLSENAGNVSTAMFSCNKDWSISSGIPEWFEVSPMSGEAGTTVLRITSVKQNTLYDDRNAIVKVRAGDVIKNITVTQKKKDAIILSTDKVELGYADEVFTIEVKSNIQYDIFIPDGSSEWISRRPAGSGTRGLNSSSESFTVMPSLDEKREGTVMFTYGNITEKVTVFQSAADSKELMVLSANPVAVDNHGEEELIVELSVNVDYDVNISDEDACWVSLTDSQHVSDRVDRLYFSVGENTSAEGRYAEVVISDKDSSRQEILKIMQGEAYVITVDTDLIEVSGAGGMVVIEVMSNIDYDVIHSNDRWITEIPYARGVSPNVHTFMIEPLDGRESRKTSVTFKAKGSGLSATVSILQCSDKCGIYTAEDLFEFAGCYRSGEQGDNMSLRRFGVYDLETSKWRFTLEGDIDLNPGIVFNPDGTFTGGVPQQWPSIGDWMMGFDDVFDGNGYTVSGVYISVEEGRGRGFFSVIRNGGVVSGLNLGPGCIKSYLNDAYYLGAFCESLTENGVIADCSNSCYIEDAVQHKGSVGGIAGRMYDGRITSCVNMGVIRSKSNAGGICGTTWRKGVIADCVNTGKLYGESWQLIGGIAGSHSGAVIENCRNEGDIFDLGGLAGDYGHGAGGITGENNSLVAACANNGDLYLADNVNGGGIAGIMNYSGGASVIVGCANKGNVAAGGSACVGGIVGMADKEDAVKIAACYTSGIIEGGVAGGVVGSGVQYGYMPGPALWLDEGAKVRVGSHPESSPFTDRKTSTEIAGASFALNQALQLWNADNPDKRCGYEFTDAVGGYPEIKRK